MELTLVTAKQPIFMNLNGIKSHDSKNIAIEKACWEEDHNFTKEGCSQGKQINSQENHKSYTLFEKFW